MRPGHCHSGVVIVLLQACTAAPVQPPQPQPVQTSNPTLEPMTPSLSPSERSTAEPTPAPPPPTPEPVQRTYSCTYPGPYSSCEAKNRQGCGPGQRSRQLQCVASDGSNIPVSIGHCGGPGACVEVEECELPVRLACRSECPHGSERSHAAWPLPQRSCDCAVAGLHRGASAAASAATGANQ